MFATTLADRLACNNEHGWRVVMTRSELSPQDIDAIVSRHNLGPHSLGGLFAETWRAEQVNTTGRAIASSILLLVLPTSHPGWHTVDAEEVWTHCAGADVIISIVDEEDTGELVELLLSPTIGSGSPQIVVPAGVWQCARPVGAAALVSCITSPAFEPEGYRPAPPDWAPPAASR
jgi:uncharacterized protein